MRASTSCFLLVPFIAAAQTGDTTAVSSALSHADELIGKARYDSAITVLGPVIEQAKDVHWLHGLARAQQRMGIALGRSGRYAEADARMRQALAGFTTLGDTAAMAKAESDIAFGLKLAMRTKDGFSHNARALELYTAIRDTVGMALTLNNMSAVHSDMGDFDTAGELLGRAYALLKVGGRPELRKTLTVMAQLAERRGDLPRSIAYADTAVALHRAAGDMRGAARALSYRSRAKLKADQRQEALTDARAARSLTADPIYLLDAVVAEGKALHAMDRAREALAVFKEAERLAMGLGNAGMVGMMQMRQADLLASLGEHEAANTKLKRYMHLQDSCRVESSTREVTRAEMNLAFAKEQLADSLENVRSKELAERDHAMRLNAERYRSVLFAVCATAVLLLALVLWSRLRYVRRTRDAMVRTQQRLVESERQREAEHVRTRIARDVHDEIGGELTKINLLVAQKRTMHPDHAPIEALEEVAELAQHVSGSLNDVVWAVDPRNDTVGSLLLHARHFAERSLAHHPAQVQLRFSAEGEERAIDPARKRDLFLVLKEALNNAMKYSGARTITVELALEHDAFRLVVMDDGAGFDPASVELEGNGLRNMRARAAAMGATWSLLSRPGEGCAVRLSGPLAA